MEPDRNNKPEIFMQKFYIMNTSTNKTTFGRLQSAFSFIVVCMLFANINYVQAEAETCPAGGNMDCRVGALLTEIEKASSELKSFQAEMKYDVFQPLVDSQRIRTGKLYYQVMDEIVYARIHFDDLLELDLMDDEENPKPVKFDEDYYFDGLWVHRMNAQTKTVERWEVARTRQARESFRLGQGPFPLPFAITKADLQEFFTVEIVKPESEETVQLNNTIHLKLTPKPDTKYAKEYMMIEIWVQSDSYLPVKFSYQEKDYNQTSVLWSDIQTGKTIDEDKFKTPKKPRGWTETVHPFEE